MICKKCKCRMDQVNGCANCSAKKALSNLSKKHLPEIQKANPLDLLACAKILTFKRNRV